MKHIPLRLALTLSLAFAASAALAQEADTHRLPPKEVEFEFEGPFGTYDRGALQRGFQVYKEVCGACHALGQVAFHTLAQRGGPGFSEAQAKGIAAGYKIPAEPNDKGETTDDSGERLTRPGILADYFPSPFANDNAARANNGGSLPPDLSLMIKARHHGARYVYSLLTGFGQTPPKGFTVTKDKHYNPYFEGRNIGMPAPLQANSVTYADGTKATVEQEAHDVVTFLAWASEPKMEERKQMGFSVILFLLAFAGVLFMAKKKLWSDVH